MIDVNMLPRELTGYVGHVCGLWFGSYFIRIVSSCAASGGIRRMGRIIR